MLRLLLAFGLTLHLATSGGAGSGFGEEICSQTCPDDGPDGKCPASCADCTCCPHFGVLMVAPMAKAPRAVLSLQKTEWTFALPLSPEPGEILHVPIYLA